MDEQPLISVIVPVYKVEEYLDQCMQSILRQTYRNLEIILVDDGSPDNCPAMCDNYAALDSRVKVIHKANGGLSSARNAGMDVAQGEFIGFVDSDDWIAESMYEMMIDPLIADENIAMSACRVCYVKSDGSTYEPNFDGNLCRNVIASDVLPSYFILNAVVYAWNKLYRRASIRKIRFTEGRCPEDQLFSIKLALQLSRNGYSMVEVKAERCYFYRYQRPGNITFGRAAVILNGELDNWEELIAYYHSHEASPDLMCALQKRYVQTLLMVSDGMESDLFDNAYYDSWKSRFRRLPKLYSLRCASKRHKIALVILLVSPMLWGNKKVRKICMVNDYLD